MVDAPRALTVLGSTGSIGRNTLDVAARLGLRIHALTAHRRTDLLAEQAQAVRPEVVVVTDPAAADDLERRLAGTAIRIAVGHQAAAEVAGDGGANTVMTAMVGGAGLAATLAAVRAGKRVCIANKEPLVMAGALITGEAARCGATLLPVDSEHSAIFQCLDGRPITEVDRLVITGSGGPLRTVRDLSQVTREQALAHPTWAMGPKITIDSATLMNKALELIEARWLFGLDLDRIGLLIHPQSVVHSLVAFRDGSLLAQLGVPDMRLPIQVALTWPAHAAGPVPAPDLAKLASLTFEEPDRARFPAVDLGYAAGRTGGLAPVALNAANEVAVARFLAGQGGFLDIVRTVERELARAPVCRDPSLADILAADAEVRTRLERGP